MHVHYSRYQAVFSPLGNKASFQQTKINTDQAVIVDNEVQWSPVTLNSLGPIQFIRA